jgi:hypothetical protein
MPSHHKRSCLCLLILKELRKLKNVHTPPNEPISTGIWYAFGTVGVSMSASDRIKRRALNSAVECHLHTFSRSNTFNNLTRLPGTAKYLIIRGSENENGGRNGG